MFEEQDNCVDYFESDTRNRRGGKNAKKRNNKKENLKRGYQIEKRNGC